MTKKNNWIALDKMGVSDLHNLKRPLSRIEALYLYTVDVDKGFRGSVRLYSRQWNWSRDKVAKFLHEIHSSTGSRTNGAGKKANELHFILLDKKATNRPETGRLDSSLISVSENKKAINQPAISHTNKTKNKNKNSDFDPLSVKPEWISVEDWSDLVTHRKSIKKAVHTPRAYKSIVTELSVAKQRGFTPRECVDEMANRSWIGFKAEWMNGEPKQSDWN